jgi:hypothetical protein
MFLNNCYADSDTGIMKVFMAYSSDMQLFAMDVKALCHNDPTQNNGMSVIFEFSPEDRFGNFIEFDRLFRLQFGC